jgi:ferredoxin-NADP reductase
MAQQRIARLLSTREIHSDTRLLRFATEDALGFTGGQYIIVNTGIAIGEGKIAKRAYSLLSSDTGQSHFEIAVRRIHNGPGSNYMLSLAEGSELAFSGPWGKLLPRVPDSANITPTLVLATDTGITAALGLVNSAIFAPSLAATSIFWLSESDKYFLPESFVRERIPTGCKHFEVVRIPADTDGRESWLSSHQDSFLKRMLSEPPSTAFLSGDGFLLSEFRDAMRQSLPHPPEILIETFFHHQAVKTAIAAV